MGSHGVSVIIPSYNSAQWVAEAVDSALAQTTPPAQVMVVDDGSTDGTHRALAPYVASRVEYIYQQNGGVAVARNTGVARSRGELIAFLDADDVWHPKKLEIQVAALLARPECIMLGSATYDWPGSIPDLNADKVLPHAVCWRDLAVKNYFTTSSVLVRRSALLAVGEGPFDPELRGPEDYDLWLRISELGEVCNLPMRLTGYRTVAGSLGRQARTMEAGVGRILQKISARGGWSRNGDALLRRKAHAFYHYWCAYMYREAGERGIAIRRLIRSMAEYPFPFARSEVRMRHARLKLLTTLILGRAA
jgi:glycosyltransferase involved in cell wall biosynthesis